MKKIIFMLSSVILIAGCDNISNKRSEGTPKNATLNEFNLKGRVQSFTETHYQLTLLAI